MDASPNKLKVPEPLIGAFSAGLGCSIGALGAGFGEDPPKKPPNAGAGFLEAGVGAGSTFFTAGGDENKENVPLPFGAGALTGTEGVLGAGFGEAPPKSESVGEGLRAGAGLVVAGLTSKFFAAGLLPKRLKGCGLGLGGSTIGSGLGGATGAGALVVVPKKELNASVMAFGAISTSAFSGFVNTLGGSDVSLALGFSAAGCRNENGLDGSAFFSAFTGVGSEGLTGTTVLVGAVMKLIVIKSEVNLDHLVTTKL